MDRPLIDCPMLFMLAQPVSPHVTLVNVLVFAPQNVASGAAAPDADRDFRIGVQAVWSGQLSIVNQAQLSFNATVVGGAGDWAELLPDSQVTAHPSPIPNRSLMAACQRPAF